MPTILQKSTVKAASRRVRYATNRSRAPLPAHQKKQKAMECKARQEGIDAAFSEWYADTLAKANAYAEKFGKKPRFFLDLFFHGGARMIHKHKKRNPHNAFLSLKARELRDEGKVLSLLDIQKEFNKEYEALGEEEQDELVQEHQENLSTALATPHVSSRSHIQDFANTAENIKKLFNGLKARVGVEGFFCIVRNTTTYHTIPQWFFTSPELEAYMKIASKNWSLHNVGTKVEAFAIAGCDPINLCTTSKKKADYYKMVIREKIQTLLIDITGNPTTVMQYARYEQDIVQCYSVVLEGWTYKNLVNPSELSTSLVPLRALHDALANGTCKFVKLTASQKKERELTYQTKLETGEIVLEPRKKRKDAGQPRTQSRKRVKVDKDDTGVRARKDGDNGDDSDSNPDDSGKDAFKSASVVDSDAD